MKHKVKVTVLDKKLYPELQKQYCANPDSGACPCYNVGDEFVFYRDDERDDFWHMFYCVRHHMFHNFSMSVTSISTSSSVVAQLVQKRCVSPSSSK